MVWLLVLGCAAGDADGSDAGGDTAPSVCLSPGVATVCESCTLTLDWSELDAELDGEAVEPTDVDGATLLITSFPLDQVECTAELEQSDILAYQALGLGETSLTLEASLLYPPPDTNLVFLLVGDAVVNGVVLVPDPASDTDGLLLR